MLQGEFYHINSDGCIVFNAAHPIFKAHFPSQPIVPGACLLQIVEEVAGKRITAIRNLKFLCPVTPDKHPRLVIHDTQVQIEDENIVYAKMSIEYNCNYSNL